MKCLLLLPILTSFLSCITIHEKGMVFYEDFPKSRLWVDDKEIDLKGLQKIEGRRQYTRISFDPIDLKIWAWNCSSDFKYLFMIDITNGIYDPKNEIRVIEPDNLGALAVYFFNNEALVEYRWGLYGIVNIKTSNQNIVDLRNILNRKNTNNTIGFDSKSILFCNGYYNLSRGIYIKYEVNLDPPRCIPNENKLIGFDENNYIVIYDIQNKMVKTKNIYRNKFNPTNSYDADELYYLENNVIFLSQDAFLNSLSFLRSPAKRIWYRYEYDKENRITKKRIFTPSVYAKILGRMTGNIGVTGTNFFMRIKGTVPQEPEVGVVE
jgi:hypothetical protein